MKCLKCICDVRRSDTVRRLFIIKCVYSLSIVKRVECNVFKFFDCEQTTGKARLLNIAYRESVDGSRWKVRPADKEER